MRIEGWSVDAFGHLHDDELQGLGSGVNVVVGPNEAGKTTLLHFLRWVLFGFPHHGKPAYRQYKPESGKFGGRVRVVHHDRLIVVERHVSDKQPTLTNENGSPVTDITYGDIVGTAKRELFESVFAITVDELSDFDPLNTDDVREHIYAASVVGSGRSARSVLDDLDEERKHALSPRKGEIRSLAKELKQQLDLLNEAQREAQALPSRRSHVDDLLAEVKAHRATKDTLTTQAALNSKLLELWPTWSASLAAREQLGQLPPPVDLPADPAGSLDRAIDQLNQAEEQLDTATTAMGSATRAIEEIELDDALSAVADDVRSLDRTLPVNEQERSQLAQHEVSLRQQQRLVEERLTELGAGWTEERATAVDTSIAAVGEIEAFGHDLRQAAQDEQIAQAAVDAADQRAKDRIGELEESKGELEAIQARLAGLSDKRAALEAAQQLRQLLPTRDALRQASGQQAGFTQALEQMNRRASPTLPRWLGPAAFVVTLVAAVGAIAGFATGAPALGALLAAMTVASAAGAMVIVRSSASAAEADGPAKPVGPPTTSSGEADLISEKIDAAAATAGLNNDPTAEAVETLLENLRLEQAVAETTAALTRRAEKAQTELDQTTESHGQRTDGLTTLNSRWEGWLGQRGMPDSLKPDTATMFVSRARSAREAIEAAARLSEQIAELVTSVGGHLEATTDVLARAGSAVADDPYRTLFQLAQRIEENAEEQERLTDLESQLVGLEDAVTRAREEADAASRALTDLVTVAGSDGQQGFRKAIETELRRAELDKIISDSDVGFRGAFGDGTGAIEAKELLSTGDVTVWETDKVRLDEDAAQADAEHEAAVREHQDAASALIELERSADVPQLSLEVEALRSAMEQAMERWAVATVAHKAIADTLGRFERERQPAVVQRAADSFGRITDQRYAGLLPEQGDLQVLLPSGIRFDAGQLSRGATEQLYLAMRFGLALDYAEKTPLPLILDDVLVNADPERRERLAAELALVSEQIQVLLFTCHPETAELMSAGRPDTTVRQLGT